MVRKLTCLEYRLWCTTRLCLSLGPLLFLIYINDLVHYNLRTNDRCNDDFVLFADDTNIFVAGQNEEEVYLNAQNNFNGYNQLHILVIV